MLSHNHEAKILSAPTFSGADLVVGDVPVNVARSVMEIVNDIVEFEAFRLALVEFLHRAVLAESGVNPDPIGACVKNNFELLFLRANV